MSDAMVSQGVVFPRGQLLDLFAHLEWADATVWTAVGQSSEAQTDEALRGCLAHIHVVQRAFLDAWVGEPPTFRDASHFADLASVRAFVGDYYAAARAFIERTEQSQFDAPIVLPWADWVSRQFGRSIEHPTLGETVMQVITHSGYHRGQVNARLRAVGGTPPLVDYIAWIWLGRPRPAWT